MTPQAPTYSHVGDGLQLFVRRRLGDGLGKLQREREHISDNTTNKQPAIRSHRSANTHEWPGLNKEEILPADTVEGKQSWKVWEAYGGRLQAESFREGKRWENGVCGNVRINAIPSTNWFPVIYTHLRIKMIHKHVDI